MAVATVDAVVADVMFMTELDRLLALDPLARVPRRTIQFDRDPQKRNNNEESAIDRNLGKRIRAVMEDLWHRRRIKRRGGSRTGTLADEQPTNLSHS